MGAVPNRRVVKLELDSPPSKVGEVEDEEGAGVGYGRFQGVSEDDSLEGAKDAEAITDLRVFVSWTLGRHAIARRGVGHWQYCENGMPVYFGAYRERTCHHGRPSWLPSCPSFAVPSPSRLCWSRKAATPHWLRAGAKCCCLDFRPPCAPPHPCRRPLSRRSDLRVPGLVGLHVTQSELQFRLPDRS